jgi:hypothetical protein
MFFYKLLNFFYNDRILGQAGRKIGESVGSISRGPTPGVTHATMSSAVQTLTKVKAWTVIMAVDVYSCC